LIGSVPRNEGGGLTINVSRSLRKYPCLAAERSGGSVENQVFEDALHKPACDAVELVKLAGPKYPLRLEHMRDMCEGSHQPRAGARPEMAGGEPCCFFCKRPREQRRGGRGAGRADYAECRAYCWMTSLSLDRTRSIITLMFTKLAQPLRRGRETFLDHTTVRPEDTFRRKIIVINIREEYFLSENRRYHLEILHTNGNHGPAFGEQAVMNIARLYLGGRGGIEFPKQGDSDFQADSQVKRRCTVYSRRTSTSTASAWGQRRLLRVSYRTWPNESSSVTGRPTTWQRAAWAAL